jgi:hypothetical protein
MHNILNWYDRPYTPKGIPERTDATYTDVFNPKKPMAAHLAPWLDYHPSMPFPPVKEDLKLPAHMYMVVKKNKTISFDFFSFNAEKKVVSKKLLDFIQEQGLSDGYEISEASIVNTKGELLTKNPYYFLRVSRFQDEQLNFVDSSKTIIAKMQDEALYNEIHLAKNTKQKVFFSPKTFYSNSLLIDESLANIVKNEFYMPALYSAPEYTQVWLEIIEY